MRKKFFEGYYYKHQKDDNTLCLITGKSVDEAFIQVITNTHTFHAPGAGNSFFSKDGIKLDIQTRDITLTGEILYRHLTVLNYDIMGPFQYFKMECRHGIISMRHALEGKVLLNGKELDFTGGTGYIEKDSGTSFPKSYVWMQCNHFPVNCSVMVSVADIPFCGFNFKGCICVVHYNNKEYRLATYLGVKIIHCSKRKIILTQRQYRLEVSINSKDGQKLFAPSGGQMIRTIKENPSCPVTVKFFSDHELLFDLSSDYASFEYEE